MGGTIRKDKVKLAKEKALLHASVQKDKRLAAKVAKQKQKATLAKDKAADKEKQLEDKVARVRSERDEKDKKAQSEEIALAGAKAKAVAQQAKDAIAEGQTKGQLTVVLGKLKGDKATISELRKELVNSRKAKSGGQGLELKAKLVEEEVKASQKEASRELTRSRAKEKLLELKVKEVRKRKNGYKARLAAKSKLMQKQVDTKATELKVCMARSVGYQKQIAACIGAEKALKREELSMQALTKLSKEKLASALRKRRKQLAICQAKATGLERHLQDKMVLKTKLESTERVLKEWKTTGKALQGQVHRLTLQRNQEMLKQQKAQMELSLSSGHVLHEKLRLTTELDTGTETSTGRTGESLSGVLLLAAEVDLEARLGLTLAKTNVNTRDLAGSLALAGLVSDLESTELKSGNTEGTDKLANLKATDLEMLVFLGNENLVLSLDGVLRHDERVLLGEEGLLLVAEAVNLEASTGKLLVGSAKLHLGLLLLEHLLVTLKSETVDLALEGLACGLPLLEDTLSGLELGLKNHLVLEVTLEASGLSLADSELLAALAKSTSELLLGKLGESLHGKLLTLEGLLGTNTSGNLLLVADRAGHTDLKLSGLSVDLLLHELTLGLKASLVAVLALPNFLDLKLEELRLDLKTLTAGLLLADIHELLAKLPC